MKKLLVTAAIILSASLSFYAKQINLTNSAQSLKAGELSKAADFGFKFNNGQRMDIGQADIK